MVPTPIGNLEDITLRALRVLRESDLIACEDTRRTGKLLAHYEIETPMLALHEHNEESLGPELAERALTEAVALVTDAGTPLVSDPGFRLVRACIEAGVPVEALPGPSAAVTALVVSGLPADGFVFLGFLPRKGGDRKKLLQRIEDEASTFVIFESPNRLAKTLAELPSETSVAVCRELTKLHEEVFRGTAEQARERFSQGARGEVVIVARGGAGAEPLDFEEVVRRARGYVEAGESPSRAAARAAKEGGHRRGDVYDRIVRP